jgi:transcriptional repressor NrdR
VDEVERTVLADARSEVSSQDIGEAVMNRLQTLDEVAYVRFASVYKDFRDAKDFEEILGELSHDEAVTLPSASGDDD